MKNRIRKKKINKLGIRIETRVKSNIYMYVWIVTLGEMKRAHTKQDIRGHATVCIKRF